MGIWAGKFFFVLALCARGICNIGFIERPIVLGLAWWAVTGNPVPALPMALFFELFWLDLYPIGGFIPPMPAFPYLLLLYICHHFHWESSSLIAFPVALTLPLAYAVPLLEMWQRNRQKNDSVKMVEHIENDGAAKLLAGKTLTRAIAMQLTLGIPLFMISCILVVSIASLPFVQQHAGLVPLELSWPALFMVGAIGAVVGLRIRRVYLAVILVAAAIGLAKFLL